MKGIDISNNDGNVDFQAVKNAGYEIVYLKATEGLTYNDPMMKGFYDKAKAVGLKVGFYHFLRKNDPVQEAIHFLNSMYGLESDCIPMIDVEHDSLKDGSAAWRTQRFADYCKSQGVQVGLYTYSSFLKESMDNNTLGLPLWIAEYGVDKPHISQSYVGFQYSETGQVPGISTNCDLDEFEENILNGGMKKVKNIVCINNSVDARAAGYLSDFLQCPIIDNLQVKFDYSVVENVYCVGGGQFTEHAKQIIKGVTRYDTCQAVLDFIKNGGK